MWKQYKKHATQEMRAYVAGESLSGISVNSEDTPEVGGMIARNSENHKDQWYVAKDFFRANYQAAGKISDKFYWHIKDHLDVGQEVICKICDRTYHDIVNNP